MMWNSGGGVLHYLLGFGGERSEGEKVRIRNSCSFRVKRCFVFSNARPPNEAQVSVLREALAVR